jgi:hypothetical protein
VIIENPLINLYDPEMFDLPAAKGIAASLITPFLLKMLGVETQEVDRWTKGQGIWCGIRARIPLDVATHGEPRASVRRRDFAHPLGLRDAQHNPGDHRAIRSGEKYLRDLCEPLRNRNGVCQARRGPRFSFLCAISGSALA